MAANFGQSIIRDTESTDIPCLIVAQTCQNKLFEISFMSLQQITTYREKILGCTASVSPRLFLVFIPQKKAENTKIDIFISQLLFVIDSQ